MPATCGRWTPYSLTCENHRETNGTFWTGCCRKLTPTRLLLLQSQGPDFRSECNTPVTRTLIWATAQEELALIRAMPPARRVALSGEGASGRSVPEAELQMFTRTWTLNLHMVPTGIPGMGP